MVTYAKICPRCGHENDEFADACEKDGEFLGMVPATPVSDEAAASEPQAEQESPAPSAPLREFGQPARVLYLDVTETAECHQVRDGWVVGQAHPTSTADVQLEGATGINYVHRRHCRFECRDDAWYVTAIEQDGYTNPTFVNHRRLAPDETAPLRNGDRLSLSSVSINVRIIEL